MENRLNKSIFLTARITQETLPTINRAADLKMISPLLDFFSFLIH